jgi:uncharacterized protein
VLRELHDPRADRDQLAYDAIVETCMDVHALPVSLDEWEHPEHHTNPALIRTIKREGVGWPLAAR